MRWPLWLAGAIAAPTCALPAPPPKPTPGSWGLDIGAAMLHAPVYAGARRKATDVFPEGGFTLGTRLKGSIDDGIRWTAARQGPVQIGPVVEYRQSDRFRKTLPTRGNRGAIEAGGFVQVDTPVAELEARLRRAVTGYQGWSADVSADTGLDIGRFRLGAEARAEWADQRYVHNLYGPDAHRRPERNGTQDAPAYVTAGLEGDVGYRLTPRLTWGIMLSHDRFLHPFDSTARPRNGITQLGTALSWHFGTAPAE